MGAFPSTAFFFSAAAALLLAAATARAEAPADPPPASRAEPSVPATPEGADASKGETAESRKNEGTEAAKTPDAVAAAALAAAATRPITGSVEAGISEERSQFNQVRIGDSPVILVPGDSVRRTEPFRHFAAAVNANVPTKVSTFNFLADANYDTHTGFRSSDVDTVFAQGDAGLQYSFGKNITSIKGVIERWKVGGEEFRRVHGVGIDLVTAVTDQVSTYFLFNFNTYRHPGDQSVLDADYRAITGNVRIGTKDAWSSAYTLQATVSRELNKDRNPALDVDGVLIRAAWDSKPYGGWDLGVSTILQRSSFGDVDPLFGLRRVDRYTGLDVQFGHDIGKSLYARFDIGYARYRSNVTALDNDWASVGVVVTWKF